MNAAHHAPGRGPLRQRSLEEAQAAGPRELPREQQHDRQPHEVDGHRSLGAGRSVEGPREHEGHRQCRVVGNGDREVLDAPIQRLRGDARHDQAQERRAEHPDQAADQQHAPAPRRARGSTSRGRPVSGNGPRGSARRRWSPPRPTRAPGTPPPSPGECRCRPRPGAPEHCRHKRRGRSSGGRRSREPGSPAESKWAAPRRSGSGCSGRASAGDGYPGRPRPPAARAATSRPPRRVRGR